MTDHAGLIENESKDWAEGWIAGAAAMAKLLTTGTYEEWTRDRDEFFAARSLNKNGTK